MHTHPSSASATAPPHPHLLVRWFVQFNPLFTASALCVLGGVFLLARALGDDAALALTGVLELYQWLLIGVAALLYRRLLERRPAAILGVIQLVLMTDPTLQLSALASAGAFAGSAAWVGLFALKLHALAWAFQLRASRSARWLPVTGALVIALVPAVRVADVAPDALRFILGGAVFAMALAASSWPPRVSSARALSEHGLVMLPRLVRAAGLIGIAGFFMQACNAALAEGLASLLVSAGALAFVAVARSASDARWLYAALGAVLVAIGGGGAGALGATASFTSVALFVALALAARNGPPRVLVAAVLSGGVALLTSPPLDALARALVTGTPVVAPSSALLLSLAGLVLAASAPLVVVLWRRRGWSALVALPLVQLAWTRVLGIEARPDGGQWGALLVVAGFALLPLGVVLHRRFARILELGEDARTLQGEAGSGASDLRDAIDAIDARAAPVTSASVSLR